MKKVFSIIVFACLSNAGMAQRDSLPIYLRFPTVPPFNIIRVPDSTRFTKDDLSKKKATIIIIFSPDCDHCQHATKELTSNISLFKKAQIVMASSLEYSYLKKFYEEYKIADHPNIIMGRDPSYFFGTFFQVRSFPAIFVYDKKGDFIKSFDGSVPIERVAEVL